MEFDYEFILRSTAFEPGGVIPEDHAGEGSDLSPPLNWSGVPLATEEFALICEDLDAPLDDDGEPFAHWVLYHLSPRLSELPGGIPPRLEFDLRGGSGETGSIYQGLNSSGTIGYEGPMPPKGHGWHHYRFRLFALDQKLDLMPGLTRERLLHEMREHVLGEAILVGVYRREFGQQPLVA